MKNNLFKKSMSVFLSVLMLMSCWVWVAPVEAEAADGSVNPTALTAIYNGSGDRGNGSRIVICSDGEAGNTTVGHIRFNISSFSTYIANATLTLSTGNHGGTLVNNCRVDVYPLQPNKCQATAGTYLVNNIANVYGGTYNSATGVTNALNFYNLSTSDRLGTVYQNAPGSHTIDVTNAVQNAKSSGLTEICFLFIMPEIFNDGNGNSWSDTHINVSGTSLSYTAGSAPSTSTSSLLNAAINKTALEKINTSVDTNMTTTSGTFHFAGKGDQTSAATTARRNQSFVNVLYSPDVTSSTGAAVVYSNVPNADNVRIWYPETVLMYDGNQNPKMGILLEADGSANLATVSAWMSANSNGLTYNSTGTSTHWKGIATNDSCFYYIMYDSGQGYCATTDGQNTSTRWASSAWSFFANHLVFNSDMSDTEWVRTIKPTWKFRGGSNYDGIYDGTTYKNIYVMNIKGYRSLLNKIEQKKTELLRDAHMYTTASIKAFADAANVITTTLAPKNYVSTSSHNVTSWNNQMIGAYNTYTAAVNGLTKRTFDIGYENLFSISDWYNSNSATAINGEVTADPAAGTVTLKNTGTSEAFTNYNSSKNVSHSYTFPVVAGEKYTAEYKTTSADSSTELFMFFYDSSDNYLGHDNMATGGTRCVKSDFTAPSGAVKAEIRFDVNDSGKTITFKDIAIYKTSRENDYQISSWPANPYTKGVTYNSTIGTLGTPSRNGYNSFDGWYYDEAYTQPVKSTDTLTASKTVYAKWSNPIEYTITYDADGGNITSTGYTTRYTIEDEFILPSAERAGHTFKGWKITEATDRFAQSDLNGQVFGANNYGKGLYGNATMVAQWEAKTYTVTFINTAGTTVSTQTLAYGKTPTAPANTATVSNGASGHTVYTWPAIGAVTGDVTYKEIATTSDHNFGAWTTETASTCTSEGAKYRTCNTCGYRENSTIEKASHTLVHVAAVAPTCTVDGNIEYWYCSACSKKFSDENGTNEITDVTDAKKGHTEVTIPAVESTCTNTGLTEGKKCSVCGTITVAQQTTDKKAHSMGAWSQTTAPTCDTAGQETRKCENCDYTETKTIPATGNHTLGDYIIDKDATCVTPGLKHKECTVCDYETAVEAIPATGVHVYGDWSQFNDGTTHRRYCTLDTLNCQAYEEGTHVFNGATRQMDSGNYHQYKCDKCEAYGVGTQMNIGEACFGEGTTYENTDANSHKVTCKCGREKTEGHALEKVDGTYVAPTCLVDGAQGWKCTKCDYTYTETLTATGHTPAAAVTENTVDSSCYAEGSYDEVVYCAVESCKTELSRTPKTIEKKEHTPAAAVREDIKKANCTNEGSYNEVVYCSVCKAAGRTTKISTESKTINARGHKYGEWTETVAPTYTKDGEKQRTCTNAADELYEACTHTETEKVPMLVDTTAPTGTITYNDFVWREFLEDITFGIYTCDDVKLKITAEDAESGVAKIEYYISDTDLTKAEVTALNDWTAYDSGVTISKVDAAKKVVYAKLTNTQNCVSYISTDGFTFDLTAPVITSDITCTTATITVNEANIDKVIVDDEEVALTDGKYTITGKGTYTVKAIDKAGNATEEITVEIKGHTEGEAVTDNEVEPTCTTAGSYDEVVYCTVETCKAEISRKTVTIEPIGHSYSAEVTTRPTQNADGTWTKGVYTYTCSRCGDSYTEEASRADYSELENIVEELNNLLKNEKLTDEGKSAINKALAKEEAFADNLVEIEQKQINDLVEELKKTKATAENIIANAGMPQPITEAISGLKVQFLEADDIHTIESLQLNAGGGFDAARLRLTNNNATLPITVKSVIADKAYIGSSKSASSAEYKTATVINKDGSKDFYIVAPSGFNQTGLITYTITYNIGSSTEGYLKDKDGNAVVFETKAYIYVKGAAVTPYHLMDERAAWPLTATSKWQHVFEASNYGDFEIISNISASKFSDKLEVGASNFGFRHDAYDYADKCQAGCKDGNYTTGDAHAATYKYYVDTSLAPTWEAAGFRAKITESATSVYENAPLKYVRLAVDQTYLDGITGTDKTFTTTFVPSSSSNVPNKTWTVTSTGTLDVKVYENPNRAEYLFGEHKNNNSFDETSAYVNFSGTIPSGVNEAKMMFSPRIEFNGWSSSESVTMTSHIWITSYDKGALRAAVNEAESGAYNRNYFTSASWSTYETALAAAKEVLGKVETTQGAVNDAETALTNAIKGLAREEYVLTLTHESYEGGLDAEKTATKIEYFLLFKDSPFTPALDSDFEANAKLNKHDETVELTIDGTKEQTYKYWHEHVYIYAAGNGTQHVVSCQYDDCDYTTTENCSGGTATCTDKAICEKCNTAWGSLNGNNHASTETHVDGYVAPTCTTPGATGDTKYSCCDAVKVASTVIPVDADAHTGEANVVKNKADATCTAEGYTGDIHWSCCDALKTKGEAIEALGHKDENKDHKCDNGCNVYQGEHVDANKDHACDYGCAEKLGEHMDSAEDKDHVCDYGCGAVLEECVDNDKDHKCDNGCEVYFGEHKDTDKDHACDYGCKETIGTCEDEDKDHDCDYGCDKVYGTCEDNDKDHDCDYGCDKVYGTCEDKDKDHDCDYGCDKYFGTHADSAEDKDHVCDYGCGAVLEECVDNDKDHKCDNGCDKVYGEHVDSDKNHVCDYGCDKYFGTHADSAEDKDHVCDYGCGAVLEECVDNDKDHKCDNGCDKVYGDHIDSNKDHACDYGCAEKLGEHKDSADDGDHICDYCKSDEILEGCTAGDWIVDVKPTCEGKGSQYKKCTVCGKVLDREDIPSTGHDYDRTKSETNLTRPVQNADGIWAQGYYTYTCKNDSNHKEKEYVDRAGYTAYESALENLKELLETDITDTAKEAIKKAIEDNKVADNLIASEQETVDNATSKLEETIEQYKGSLKTYTVTFKIEGSEDVVVTVFSGNDATAPQNPAKAYDETNHYDFDKWDKEFTNITSDTVVTAVFKAVAHTYTHTDKDDTHHTDSCACGYSKDVEHDYTTSAVTKKATCDANGERTYTCEACRGTKVVAIEKRAHVYRDTEVQKDATCLAEGVMGTICTNGETDEYAACTHTSTRPIAKLSHSYTGEYKWNNSTTPKTHSQKCVNGCNEYGNTAECTFNEVVTAPTCFTGGYTTYTCTVCSNSYTADSTAMRTHDYKYSAGDGTSHTATCQYDDCAYTETENCSGGTATCTDKAICEKCNTAWGSLNGNNHASTETYVDGYKAPTCTTEGATGDTKYDCCNAVKVASTVIPIDADAHTGAANVTKNAKAATCTAEGYTGDIYWSCCDALETKGTAIAIDKDAHTTDKTHVDGYVAPTCTTPGATGDTKYDCCNAVKVASEVIPVKADAHTGAANVVKNKADATCTAEGYTGDIHWSCCDALKTKGTAIAIDKNAHTTDKTHVDGYVAPTCTTPGATGDTKYDCCNAVKVASEEIPVKADAHTGAANVVKNKADATCTSEGYTGDIHWSCCGALKTKGEVIVKLPHTEKTREENRKEATCGADGSYDLVTYCSVCNNVIKTETQIIPATGNHIYATEVEGSRVDATCKKEGSVIFQCACGATEKTILGINTDNHENIVTDKAVAPTCTSTGLTEGSHCEACGKVIVAQKIIDVLPHKDENKDGYCDDCGTDLQEICGHSETEVRGKLAATCVSEGYTGDTYCKLCFKKLETGSAEPRTEHRYGERPVNVIGATCTAERTEVFKCENCPATKNVVQEKDKEQFAPHVIIRVTKVEPTCDKNGIDIYYCTVCSTDVEIKKTEPTGHVDKDNDGVCDIFGCGGKINPPAEDSDRCTCLCHKDGWLWNIIYKIVRFFWKLFKISKACDCGFVHY